MTLGGLKTTNADVGGNAVILNSGGSIIDGGDTHLEVDAENGTLEMTATGGIGEGNALEIKVAILKADSNGAGSIEIEETDAITLENVVATGNDIRVTSGGDMILGTVDAGNGTIYLSALTINSGIFTGGHADIYAGTVGLTDEPTANVTTLFMELTEGEGSFSGKLLTGPKLTVRPDDTVINGPGMITIGIWTYFPTGPNIYALLATLATLSTQQEHIEALLSAAASGAAEFFSSEPFWLDILMEEEEEEERECIERDEEGRCIRWKGEE